MISSTVVSDIRYITPQNSSLDAWLHWVIIINNYMDTYKYKLLEHRITHIRATVAIDFSIAWLSGQFSKGMLETHA